MSTLLEELETAAADAATTVGAATVAIGRSGRGSGVVVAEGRGVGDADRATLTPWRDKRPPRPTPDGGARGPLRLTGRREPGQIMGTITGQSLRRSGICREPSDGGHHFGVALLALLDFGS